MMTLGSVDVVREDGPRHGERHDSNDRSQDRMSNAPTKTPQLPQFPPLP